MLRSNEFQIVLICFSLRSLGSISGHQEQSEERTEDAYTVGLLFYEANAEKLSLLGFTSPLVTLAHSAEFISAAWEEMLRATLSAELAKSWQWRTL